MSRCRCPTSSSSSARGFGASARISRRRRRRSAPTPWQTFFRVTLPMIAPGIVGGGALRLRRLIRPVRHLLLPVAARRHDLAGRDLHVDPQGLHARDQRDLHHHHHRLDAAAGSGIALLPFRQAPNEQRRHVDRRLEALREVVALDHVSLTFGERRVLRPAGPQRQRQDHAAARHRRLHRTRRAARS